MIFNRFVCLAAVFSLGSMGVDAQPAQRKFKNIIMLVPDGCDDGVLGLARWYKNEPLNVDTLSSARVLPYMANSLMTDSAPGGTAFSTGQLTTDKFIAVGPRRNDLLSTLNDWDMWDEYAPIPTVLEAAKSMGMSTGLLATSRVTHATPAAFAAHVDSRSKEQEIARQMVFQNIDVVMGGGRKNMLPADECFANEAETSESPVAAPAAASDDEYSTATSVGGDRDDCVDLEEELTNRGYELCTTRAELMDLEPTPGQKVWCSFASSHMQPDIDRQYFAETEPSLPEMTQKAIDILSQNPAGFFLMVEASQVDWAGHANDPIWMVTDFIAWDDSVKVALDFANEVDPDTLVLALPDHNTGGLKIGNYKFEYLDRTVEFARDPLLKMKMTSNGVVHKDMLGVDKENATVADLQASVLENWGINMTENLTNTILTYSDKYSSKYASNPSDEIPLNYALSRVLSEKYTIAGWTTHGHNAEEVPMWVHGMDAPRGVIKNTDVGKIVADALGGLSMVDDLYVDLDTTDLSWDFNFADETNPFVTIEGYVFPTGTDYFLFNDVRMSLPGITVFAPNTNKTYVSSEAVNMIKSLAGK